MTITAHRRPLSLLAAASLACLLGACAAETPDSPDSTGSTGTGSAASGADYSFAVDNCGTDVELDAAPQRIVTIKSTSTELVLALGQGERLVGTAFADGPVPDEWADDLDASLVLSEEAPSQEVVLEAEPELVFAGWESNLAADTAGERDTLASLGVATYVSPSACQGEGYQPDPMTFDLLFDHFIEAGDLLDAPDEAAALVEKQRAELAAVGTAKPGTTALWWSSGVDTPFVGGGIGAPQMVMDAAGLTNVAASEPSTWTSLGWEAIVEADPDVLVLVDAAWNTAADKISHLESNPATAQMSAVKDERYLVIDFPAAEAGVRSVSAVADLATQLEKFGMLAP